jgi:hypothetical protein
MQSVGKPEIKTRTTRDMEVADTGAKAGADRKRNDR